MCACGGGKSYSRSYGTAGMSRAQQLKKIEADKTKNSNYTVTVKPKNNNIYAINANNVKKG